MWELCSRLDRFVWFATNSNCLKIDICGRLKYFFNKSIQTRKSLRSYIYIYIYACVCVCVYVWQYTDSWPLLSEPSKLLMAIRSSGGFSNLRPGVFHISLRTHNPQHTWPQGWKKRRTNNHGLGLALSARRERSVTLSWLSVLPFERVLERNSHKATRNADSSSQNGQPGLSSQA